MELLPFQTTQFPARLRCCRTSDVDSVLDARFVSGLMRIKQVFFSARAARILMSKSDPGCESEELGNKIRVRLCSMHSDTDSANDTNEGQFRMSGRDRSTLPYRYLLRSSHWGGRDCIRNVLPRRLPATSCQPFPALHLSCFCKTSNKRHTSSHLRKQQQTVTVKNTQRKMMI